MDDSEPLPIDQLDVQDPAMQAGGFYSPAQDTGVTPPPEPTPGTPQDMPQPGQDEQPAATPIDMKPSATPPTKTIDMVGKPPVTPTSSTAQTMASKFNFAFGTPAGEAFARIQQGREDDMRKEAATQAEMAANDQRIGILQDYAQAREKTGATNALTQPEIDTVLGLTQQQMRDPTTILEETFVANAVKTLYPAWASVRQEAADQNVHVAMSIQDEFEQQATLNEYANNLMLKAQDVQSKKGIIAQGLDFFGDIIPFVSQLNRHDAVPGTVGGSFWTADDQKAQYDLIRRQTSLEGKTKALQDAYDLIASHNQADAIAFLGSFLHYSTSDQYLDTIMNVGDIATALAPFGKAVLKVGVKAARDAAGTVAGERFNEAAAKQVAIQTELEKQAVYSGGVDGGANQAFANASKDTIKALAESPKPDPVEITAASGQLDLTAATVAGERAQVVAEDPFNLGRELRQSLPTVFNPAEAMGLQKGYSTARVYVQGILDKMDQWSASFRAAQNKMVTRSLTGAGLKEAIARGYQGMLDGVGKLGLNDAVIGVRHIMPEDTVSGVAHTVIQMARPGGMHFSDVKEGEAWLNHFGLVGQVVPAKGPVWTYKTLGTENLKNVATGMAKKQGAEVIPSVEKPGKHNIVIKQQGQGFYAEIQQPVRETGLDSVYSARMETQNATPQSWLKTWLDSKGWVSAMTPSNRLSEEQRGMRATTVNRMTEVQRLVSAPYKDSVGRLGSKAKDELSRFIDFMTRYEDPGTVVNGFPKKGIEYHSQGEFEQQFLQTFKHLPSPEQSQAYWGWKATKQMEFYIRNLEQYTARARAGSEMLKLNKDAPWIEGRVAQYSDIPWEDRKTNIQFVDDSGAPHTYLGQFRKNSEVQDIVKNAQAAGHEILQIADPREAVKSGAVGTGKADIHFVVTKAAQHQPLSFTNMPYKEGGHIIYDYPYYVKQAMVSTGSDQVVRHYGDNTVIPVTSRAEGLQHVTTLEEARRLYNVGDRAAFDNYVRMHPPFNSDDVWNKFKNGTLSKDVPYALVRAGESTANTETMAKFMSSLGNGRIADNWSESPANYLKDVNREFMGHAGYDVNGVQNLGTETSPMFEFTKPRMIDPLPALAHGMNSAIRNKFFSQYQARSAEHFVEEFMSVMQGGYDPTIQASLRENPMRALYNPKWNVSTGNKDLLAAGRSFQDAALNLIGTQTDSGRFQKHVEAWLLDKVFNTAGSNATNFVYENLLGRIKNPVNFSRQVAFHTKLGLFNPVQLLLQAQTSAISMGILGFQHGFKGLSGYALGRLLHVADSPENIEHFAGLASKMGWKSADFKDAYRMMIDNGIFNSGNQLAWKFDMQEAGMVKSSLGKFLDKGTWAFDEGNRINRMVAFMGTFSEWRGANPFAKIDEAVTQKIMSRYDDVSINMTHASSSALNRGFGAVAGQFLSWQERLTELLLSKRLTVGEKLRTFGVMSAMYGVPAAAGAYTLGGGESIIAQVLAGSGVPLPKDLLVGNLYQDLQAWTLANGAQNNLWLEGVKEGLPEMVLHAALGTQYNFGQRMGPGTGSLADNLSQSTHPYELFLGASGTIGGDIWRATMPIIGDLMDALSGKGLPKITVPDALSAIQNVSTINNAMKAYYALNLGAYMNQNHQVVDDQVTGVEGIMMGLLGLTPERIQDRTIMNQAAAAATQAQSAARQQIEKYVRMYISETDDSLKKDYAGRISFWAEAGGFSPTDRAKIVANTFKSGKTTIEQQATKKFTTAEGK